MEGQYTVQVRAQRRGRDGYSASLALPTPYGAVGIICDIPPGLVTRLQSLAREAIRPDVGYDAWLDVGEAEELYRRLCGPSVGEDLVGDMWSDIASTALDAAGPVLGGISAAIPWTAPLSPLIGMGATMGAQAIKHAAGLDHPSTPGGGQSQGGTQGSGGSPPPPKQSPPATRQAATSTPNLAAVASHLAKGNPKVTVNGRAVNLIGAGNTVAQAVRASNSADWGAHTPELAAMLRTALGLLEDTAGASLGSADARNRLAQARYQVESRLASALNTTGHLIDPGTQTLSGAMRIAQGLLRV